MLGGVVAVPAQETHVTEGGGQWREFQRLPDTLDVDHASEGGQVLVADQLRLGTCNNTRW